MSKFGRFLSALVTMLCALAVPRDGCAEGTFVLRGLGVGTFASKTTPLLGIGVGIELNPIIQINAEASREFGRADPQVFSTAAPPGSLPVDIVIIAIDNTRVDRRLTGGARFRLPTPHRLRPFAEVNAGWARRTTRYLPGTIRDEGSTEVRPLVEAGGGISVSLSSRTALEASYRIGQLVEEFTSDVVQAFGLGVAVGF